MFREKNNGFSTVTVILLVINIALAVLIAVSWFKETGKPEGVDLPGIIPIEPTETPAVLDTPIPTPAETDSPVLTETPTPVPEETPEPSPASSAHPEVKKDPEGRRPDYSDFDWYFNDVQYNGMWPDAEQIKDLGNVLGDWKAYILHDPGKTSDNPCEMLFNMDISAGQNNLELLLDWYYIWYFSKEEAEYQDNDSHFKGNWNNGTISASGSGTMNLTGFYEKDGTQYALGTMTAKDGTPAILVLVRP